MISVSKFVLLAVPAWADSEYVRVPGGMWMHRSCITEISDGTIQNIADCEHPSYRSDEWAPNSQSPEVQCYDQKAFIERSSGQYTEMNATFTVPPLPRTNVGQTVYLWPGFKATRPEIYHPVLQPVLQFTQGSGRWALQSWAVGVPAGAVTGPAIPVSEGDELFTYMKLIGNVWTIYGQNTRTGRESVLRISSQQAGYEPYNYAVFVSENVMARNHCDYYPANSGVEFKAITVDGKTGIKWETGYDCGSPDCGQKVIASDDGTSV